MRYDLRGKVTIITGANSGIGKAASIQLAQCGATVIMACRSVERGAKALEDVRRTTNSNCVKLLQVDLSSQRSIRRFVDVFKHRLQHLDVLIHNAANFDQTLKKPVLNGDEQEMVFATNHLGPFLMTCLLLDLLKASAPSSIITVASKGLMFCPFLDIEFDNLKGGRKFSLQYAYYHSKQAQMMFTFALAERLKGTGIGVHCVRVGNVAIPDERIAHLLKWMVRMYEVKRKLSITPEQMAETYVWLAANPVAGEQTGEYWDAPNIAVKANRNAYNLS